MEQKSKIVSLLCFCLLLATRAYSFELGTKSFFDNPPPARLISPVKETASLQGNALEFQWSDPIPINTGGFVFRLYKGYADTEPNLVVKQSLDRTLGSISVPADKLEKGAVYTWTLTRVDDVGRKSDPASSSFTLSK